MAVRDDVLLTAAVLEETDSDEHAAVEKLIERGYSLLRAEVLVAFVPLGLGRAVIKRLAADPPILLSDTASVRDFARNRNFKVPLSNVPEFTTALQLGEETFMTGIIPRERLSASCHSVEMNLVNEALDKGLKLGAARISPSILLRLAEVPGFDDWYRSVRRRWFQLW